MWIVSFFKIYLWCSNNICIIIYNINYYALLANGPTPAPRTGLGVAVVTAPEVGSGPANWFDVPADIDPAHYPRTGTSVSDCLAEPFVRSLYAHLKGPSCSLSGLL